MAPGFDRASAMSSFTLFTGSDGWTESRYGCHRMVVTGAKSFSVSKGRFGYTAGFMVNVLATSSMV